MNQTRVDRIQESQSIFPEDFVFSQSSLQTFVDCKRKFWLSYVVRLQWPSALASPVEAYETQIRLGEQFHRIVQRVEEGIYDKIAPSAGYPLLDWFEAYRNHRPTSLPTDTVLAEQVLETTVDTTLGARRLMAKYDLLAMDDSKAVIVDWKTGARATRPAILRQKMQTMVYPFVLAEASDSMAVRKFKPEQIQMLYWFVAAPDSPVVVNYDSAQHRGAHDTITSAIESILGGKVEADFPKVTDTEHNRRYVCGFCQYRGYCDRGEEATNLDEFEDVGFDDMVDPDALLDFSLDDVEEIPH